MAKRSKKEPVDLGYPSSLQFQSAPKIREKIKITARIHTHPEHTHTPTKRGDKSKKKSTAFHTLPPLPSLSFPDIF